MVNASKLTGFDIALLAGSCMVMAFMIPLAILVSRDRLREYRRGLVMALEQWLYQTNEPPITSFEAARIKYEMGPRDGDGQRRKQVPYGHTSWLSYVLPATIYSGLLGLCFCTAMFLSTEPTFWENRNFILSGMANFGSDVAKLSAYQQASGGAITAGFLGAFLFTLQYLVQRVRSYELSPISFLIAAITLLEGCFIVSIVRLLLPKDTMSAGFAVLAFTIGYFPTFGVTWMLEHLRVRQLKQLDKGAYDARYVMPTDMIDGIDPMMKFRLMESGVRDVQGMATANPVLLYVETPYNLLSILDWIGQAQLILAVGSKSAGLLRAMSIRTIADLDAMDVSDASRAAVLGAVWPSLSGTAPEHFAALRALLTRDLHVQRLQAFIGIMAGLMDRPAASGDDRAKEPGQPPAGPAKVLQAVG